MLKRPKDAEPLHHEVDEVASGSFRRRKPPEISGHGYVLKSLEAALWAFHASDDFSDAVLKAVNLGDDADTTGAVCLQLAGAHWGQRGVPKPWLERLARRDMIESALEGLLSEALAPPKGDGGARRSDGGAHKGIDPVGLDATQARPNHPVSGTGNSLCRPLLRQPLQLVRQPLG
jgi:hypothetical protein